MIRKGEIVKEISERTGMPVYICSNIVDALRDVVEEALVDGEDISIRGFVTFELNELKGRKGYNPMTGKYENFAPVKRVRCKVGDNIKEAVKNSGEQLRTI